MIPRVLLIATLLLGLSVDDQRVRLRFVPEKSQASDYTDDPAALWADDAGSGSTCTSGSPCTIATALTNVADNGTVIIMSGTYASMPDITGANHDGITITIPASVKNALTWTCNSTWVTTMSQIFAASVASDCGIVSGVDNRPLITAGGWSLSRAVTIDHLRVQMAASPSGTGFCTFTDVNVIGVTINRTELFNGCTTLAIWPGARGVVVKYSHIHHSGADAYPDCTPQDDHHSIGVYGNGGQASATEYGAATSAPTSTSGLVVSHSTISNAEGDGMQELQQYNNNAQGGNPGKFLIQEYNHVLNNCEQNFDYKGTQNAIIRYNDLEDTLVGCLISTNDNDGTGTLDYTQINWYIYGNYLHDAIGCGIFSQDSDDGPFYIWNNVIVRVCQSYQFNCGAITNAPPGGTLIENNTIVDNNRVSGVNEVAGISWPDNYSQTGVNTIRNNILYNNGQVGGARGNIADNFVSNKTITNNRCYPTTPGTCGTGAETNSANDFVNGAADDYHLATGVQSLNAATTLTGVDANHTITIDLDGNTRPFGAAWDHGAYERQSAPPEPEVFLLGNLLRIQRFVVRAPDLGGILRTPVLSQGVFKEFPHESPASSVHAPRARRVVGSGYGANH